MSRVECKSTKKTKKAVPEAVKLSVSRIFYAKSRVGSEGVTGLKTRGRPPRLDDSISDCVMYPFDIDDIGSIFFQE